MTATKAKAENKTAYHFENSKGEHAHFLGDKPLLGTSSVCKIIGNGGAFSWWASGKAVEKFGWVKKADPRKSTELEIIENRIQRKSMAAAALLDYRTMSIEGYLALLDSAYRAHEDSKQDSAVKGTDLHAELELYVKKAISENDGRPYPALEVEHWPPQIEPFGNWCVGNVERFLWSEAHCYSEKLWTGGISDAGALMKDGKVAVIDFKSSKDAYFNQFVQCAGYALQIEENGLLDAQGNSTSKPKGKVEALYVVPFGSSDVTPRSHFDVEGRKADFEAAVRLYRSSQQFGV